MTASGCWPTSGCSRRPPPCLRSPHRARWVEPALAAGAFVVIAYSLSERLLPWLVELDRGISAAGRLEQPLTYWNAMGALAAIGFVLSARLCGDAERSPRMRAAAGFIAPTLALGLFLSLSRGAIGAAAVGLAVLVLVAPTRLQLRSVAWNAALGLFVSLVSLPLPAVRSLDGGRRRARAVRPRDAGGAGGRRRGGRDHRPAPGGRRGRGAARRRAEAHRQAAGGRRPGGLSGGRGGGHRGLE